MVGVGLLIVELKVGGIANCAKGEEEREVIVEGAEEGFSREEEIL
nr:5394_t:CDS:2 [Entrophospora candida]